MARDRSRPVALIVLDGWGYRAQAEGNAIALANTPTWDSIWAHPARTLLEASGTRVGLPEGQMGNSEVGHLNLGAGRVVMQDLVKINTAIADGSFFKNPVLSHEQLQALAQKAKAKGFEIPSYPALESQRKVSAAWLVEHSGFSKGFSSGRVGISSKHALAIVNRGQASAADILDFKEHIQDRVQQIWGIRLEPEPVLVGAENS